MPSSPLNATEYIFPDPSLSGGRFECSVFFQPALSCITASITRSTGEFCASAIVLPPFAGRIGLPTTPDRLRISIPWISQPCGERQHSRTIPNVDEHARLKAERPVPHEDSR